MGRCRPKRRSTRGSNAIRYRWDNANELQRDATIGARLSPRRGLAGGDSRRGTVSVMTARTDCVHDGKYRFDNYVRSLELNVMVRVNKLMLAV
jgi:hypothetical protein